MAANELIDILSPGFDERERQFEEKLTQKLVVTFFAALVASNLIMAALDRNRR